MLVITRLRLHRPSNPHCGVLNPAGNTLGQDLNLSLERVLSSRNFTNKLWNAGKFIDFNLAGVCSILHPTDADALKPHLRTLEPYIIMTCTAMTLQGLGSRVHIPKLHTVLNAGQQPTWRYHWTVHRV